MVLELPVTNDSFGSCGMVKPLFQHAEDAGHDDYQAGSSLMDDARDEFSGVVGQVNGLVDRLNLPLASQEGETDQDAEHAKKMKPDLQCLSPYLMNCTSWPALALDRPCPAACPFVVNVKPFACTFACVSATQCHRADPAAPYANNRTKRCEKAVIKGCEVALQSPTTCTKCMRHFRLTSSGTWCTYDGDNLFIGLLDGLAAMGSWGIALLLLLIAILLWKVCSGIHRYWRLLTFARIHHHLCKVRKNPRLWPGAPLYSLCVNVHTKFILGVGLPLYYNSLVFLCLLSLTIFIAVSLVLSSDASSLFNFAATSSQNGAQITGFSLYPRSDSVSDASMCSWFASEKGRMHHSMLDVQATSVEFMRTLATTTLVLYCVVLCGMLVHAYGQLSHAEWFFDKYATMKDFAIALTGLPATATSEEGIRRFISSAINVEVQQVSIGYDFCSRREEVQALIDRHLCLADAKVRGGHPPGIALPGLSTKRHATVGLGRRLQERRHERRRLIEAEVRQQDLDEAWEADRARVRAWFAPNSAQPMEGTGYAWIVFRDRPERDLALSKLSKGLVWRDALINKSYTIQAELPYGEPSNLNWANLSYSACARRCRCFVAWMMFLVASAMLAGFIFTPYAYYVTSFVQEAGQFPDGLLMGLLGLIVGISWWAMCFTIGNCVGYIRMHTVESESLFIFVAFTLFCVFATAFNAYLTWFYTRTQWQSAEGKDALQHIEATLAEGPSTTLRDLRSEIDLGIRIFQMLVPGVLFTPCLLTPLNNFIIPYFRESVLLVLFGQNKSSREAERYLEPLPLGLPWDYQGHVTLPFCCCLTLFIMSPAMWWTLGYLTVWCFFFYFYQRAMHLRVCKKMFFTTTTLDRLVLYVGWGVLLAELAACTAFWRVRLQEWPTVSIPLTMFASTALYWLLLRCLVGVKWPSVDQQARRPNDLTQRSYKLSDDGSPGESDAEKLVNDGESSPGSAACSGWSDEAAQVYDWLNVNPIYVLKSQYCEDMMSGAAPCYFYEPGKEYLQLLQGNEFKPVAENPRWRLRDQGAQLELEGLGCIQAFVPSDIEPEPWSQPLPPL